VYSAMSQFHTRMGVSQFHTRAIFNPPVRLSRSGRIQINDYLGLGMSLSCYL
jgi:hypothetical protein